jgi:epoxyqueuosine reductase
MNTPQLKLLAIDIKQWAKEIGFQQTAITDTNLSDAEEKFHAWLDNKMHGDMQYMSEHGLKRSRAELLVPGTYRIISLRMNYYPEDFTTAANILNKPEIGYVSRYALGRDYHKLIRQRLKKLVSKINQSITSHNPDEDKNYHYRVFTDSAPILEKAIAEKAGLGWIGKHSNLINSQAGSWFFLAEIYTNLALPVDNIKAKQSHCGSCNQCIKACPTDAIVKPYVVDARKCISYLTIENKGQIPIKYRQAIGNRIYGCDDCQLVCPWNKFSTLSQEKDFYPRHKLDTTTLLELFSWTKEQFLSNFEGSPIRRIGYLSWLRNIAIALGNSLTKDPKNNTIIIALNNRLSIESDLLNEHILWALEQSK